MVSREERAITEHHCLTIVCKRLAGMEAGSMTIGAGATPEQLEK